ncbi:MAG: HlyD family efflux transporter periplasmic adaptor subunit [Butyrivibrio sp.]|nr:HlyD family efflux transporter periplasmic adaptor subunit [Butyrivibrio sp.]
MSEVLETQIIDSNGHEILPGDGKKPINKKDMVKNVAIAFLSVMLILTFFSNTIMNYSLPQVATQQITYGSISPQIRGTGTVTAEDPYNVTIKETRKISGVAVKEGSHVEIGDILFYLEDKESDELKTAREDLESKEVAYEQALFAGDVPDEVITRVRNGGSSSYDTYQAKLKELNERYDALKEEKTNLEDAKNYLTHLKTLADTENSYNQQTIEYSKAEEEYLKTVGENPDRAAELEKVIAELTKNNTELKAANSQLGYSYDEKIEIVNRQLQKVTIEYEKAEADKTEGITAIQKEISLCEQRDKIAELKEKIAALEKESVGASIKSPVAGTISSVNKASGETASADETLAVIQIDGKDMTTSFSVTNAQAQKLKVGDVAKPQNAWMFSDEFKATLTSIKNDKTDPSGKKLLTFKIESTEVTPGQSLALAIGERSIEYDMVVPNSAIKTGSTGKFVLAINSKSSPLGNRYIATNVEVEVLASDDNYTAISAALNGDEFVITTSTKPVKAGEQVRLASE